MSSINLLPWRDELRRVRNRVFLAWVIGTIVICFALTAFANIMIGLMIASENNNINSIKKEEQKISLKIKEIQDLQRNKKDLLDRMQVIQSLSGTRSVAIRLIDILPKIIPNGIYLTEIQRKGLKDQDQIIISGVSQTNATVSLFIENFQAPDFSKYFSDVKLVNIASNKENSLDFQITLNLLQTE